MDLSYSEYAKNDKKMKLVRRGRERPSGILFQKEIEREKQSEEEVLFEEMVKKFPGLIQETQIQKHCVHKAENHIYTRGIETSGY